MARSLSQGGRTVTYTLDVIGNRFRKWTDDDGTTTVSKTHHYNGDADSPIWTDEGTGEVTRIVGGIGGLVAIDSTTTGVVWQLSNIHGDIIAGMVGTTPGLAFSGDYGEYGQPRNPTDVGTRRYGWLGAAQRAADTPGGMVSMGQRLYGPATGRFSSVDPVFGGSANSYDNCAGVNCTDTSGLARCNLTGKWSPWWYPYTRWYFRCTLSDLDVQLMLSGLNWLAFWWGLGAAALTLIALITPCTVFCGIAAAALWIASALFFLVAYTLDRVYYFACRSHRGVWFSGYIVTGKWWLRGVPLFYRVDKLRCS
jgi:RHS repeat-associated protein